MIGIHNYYTIKTIIDVHVGPLEANAGNIVTHRFLMTEELHLRFSSVFTTREKINAPETKFNGSKQKCGVS